MAETSEGADYSVRKTRRYYSTVEAKNPHNPTGEWDVLISFDKQDFVSKRGEGAINELGKTVRNSLVCPKHIYRGIRDDGRELDEDDWLCCIATPRKRILLNGFERNRFEDEVFLIYLTEERTVFTWFWDSCHHDDTTIPQGTEDRFRQRII